MKIIIESGELRTAITEYVCKKFRVTIDDVKAIEGNLKQKDGETVIQAIVDVDVTFPPTPEAPYR